MDFIKIVSFAWKAFDDSRPINSIRDISAMVSTNHVYSVQLEDGNIVIAKLSYFGNYEQFIQDHTIINILSNNLPVRYDNFLSRSLMKGNEIFFYRFLDDEVDAWVIFYRPISIKERLPNRLDNDHIDKLAVEFAEFHKACHLIRNTLPHPSKDMTNDINALLNGLDSFPQYSEDIKRQCDIFLNNTHKINYYGFEKIPVFVDWNIGNFSITPTGEFFSRWDYDWFRMSSRIVDFYFISRVVSDIGDRTVFTYNVSTMMEDRFIRFLKKYHEVYPLEEKEIYFLKESYRFFLLNYVVRAGKHFFRSKIANQLQKDTFEVHLKNIDVQFYADKLLRALDL